MTNSELAQHLRDLQIFLTIAGYDEVHARRYGHIAHEIERMGEPVVQLRREARLKEIPGVGPSIAGYLKEIIDNGKCSKQEDWEKVVPLSVIELLQIPGLGTGTARWLVHDYGIVSLEALKQAIDSKYLEGAAGVSPITMRTWRIAIDKLQSGASDRVVGNS